MAENDTNLFAPHDLTFLRGAPYVFHCHHYNLFHDQTVDDILGDDAGRKLRTDASRSAFHQVLRGLCEAEGCRTPAETIQLAQATFAAMGHGRLTLDVTREGGTARGVHTHYGYTWGEKYGSFVNRREPADAVAAGFAAATTEVAFGLPSGSMQVLETQCVAKRDPACTFEIRPAVVQPLPPSVSREDFARLLGASEGGEHEERVQDITGKLQAFLAGVSGDERGLVQAFGVFVTMHLANYYNETAFSAVREVEKSMPAAVPTAEALLREAGHVCVFNTVGGILRSPEWEAVAGPLRNDPTEIVVGCTAIARGLGFGRWTIKEFQPGERLVVSATSTYAAPFYRARFGLSDKPRSYFLEGAVLAFMVLAQRIDWESRPEFTTELYAELFRGSGLGFRSETTRCLAQGHERSEIVVTLG
ncbi:MAG: hypothetical protein AB8I08_39120 [Sandaracinaceae bacterium]